jgi:hypothetical protein
MYGCMNECETKWISWILDPFIFDTRPDGLYDSHGVLGKTFFGPRVRIDMKMPWDFVGQLWMKLGSSTP